MSTGFWNCCVTGTYSPPETPHRLSPTPLEIAVQAMFGDDPEAEPLPGPPHPAPLAAMEAAILPALERSPCMVSFSGGRDSSAILAIAVRLARRHGLPVPVPVTLRYLAAPAAGESDWQERVVRHLGLDDWERLEFTDELDFVGPVADAVLRRHGVLWPVASYCHAPLAEVARGGALLTGIGGDQVLIGRPWARPGRLPARAARAALLPVWHALPAPVRAPIVARRSAVRLAWLRPEARRAAAARMVEQIVPRRRDQLVRHFHGRRYLRAMQRSIGLVAADYDVMAVHPFTDPGFIAALAGHLGPNGMRDRTALTSNLFGELLPREVVARPDKPLMADVFCTGRLSAFVGSWAGGGVDLQIVDEEVLRREWRRAAELPRDVDFLQRTALLAQSAWVSRLPVPREEC
jgi:asparagine synthase (glutamine-hydrolysing)